jgi:hypothetical protein
MCLPILHTIAWLFLALNTQLIEGVLVHIPGAPDSISEKLVRWVATPSKEKGWLGVIGLAIEITILWFSYFNGIAA